MLTGSAMKHHATSHCGRGNEQLQEALLFRDLSSMLGQKLGQKPVVAWLPAQWL
jgi:hypothetical protein